MAEHGGKAPPKQGGAEKKSGGGFWGFVSDVLSNVSVNVSVGKPTRRGVPARNPTDPAQRMEPVRDERQEAYEETIYRKTEGADGTAPAVRVDRGRKAIARSLDARMGARAETKMPQGGGSPLSRDVRAKMEPKLGNDLSDVRVHTGGDSAAAAEGLSAKAFTVGNDVHFGAGNFQPGTKEGDRLIAHELTHVVQGAKSGVQRKADDGEQAGSEDERANVSHPDEPAEKEADSVADKVSGDLHDGKSAGEEGAEAKGDDGGGAESGGAAAGDKSAAGGSDKDGKGQDAKGKNAKGGAKAGDKKDAGKGTAKADGDAKAGASAKAEGGTDGKGAADAKNPGGAKAEASSGAPKAGEAKDAGSGGARDAATGGAKVDAGKEQAPQVATKRISPIPISATLVSTVGRKIFRAKNKPPTAGATTPPAANAPAPVTVSGSMKGVPHTLKVDAGAHTVTIDNADAVAAGQSAMSALPEAGDPRYAEANAKLSALNNKLQQLRGKVTAGTPPTTQELRALSQETMTILQAFGDKFDVKRLGDPLPQFPSPLVGPHPLTGPKPPDGSSRNSHHIPPKELAQGIGDEAEQAVAALQASPNAKELAPTIQRLQAAMQRIRQNPGGNGLTAILIHQLTHQTAGGTAVHAAAMKAQIVARVSNICEQTQRERILIMSDASKGLPGGLAVNPQNRDYKAFFAECRQQAAKSKTPTQKAQAEQRIAAAEQREQQLTTQAQTKESQQALDTLHEQARTAFHNCFAQAKAAVQAALSASHVDGPPAGRSAAMAQIDAQATQTWNPILNAGG